MPLGDDLIKNHRPTFQDGAEAGQVALEKAATLIAAFLASQPNGDFGLDRCEHCITVTLNPGVAICVLCKAKISGARNCALMISAPTQGIEIKTGQLLQPQ